MSQDFNKKKDSDEKIQFWKANKISMEKIVCGNCKTSVDQAFSCKYNIKEQDPFTKRFADKTKSVKLCFSCKNYVVNHVIPKIGNKQGGA